MLDVCELMVLDVGWKKGRQQNTGDGQNGGKET